MKVEYNKDWFIENRLAELTLRIANAEQLGQLSLAKKLREQRAEVLGIRSRVEELDDEEVYLGDND